MTFTESMKVCFVNKYCTFRGRATRSEYWWCMLVTFLLFALTDVLSDYETMMSNTMFIVLVCVLIILIIPPSLAVTVRRLHDIGMSGWWWWISLIPILGSCVLLIFMLLPSVEDNKYGHCSMPINNDQQKE